MIEAVAIVALTGVILIQQRFIGKLLDRVQAKDFPEYKALEKKHKVPEPKAPKEELEQL